MQCIGLGTSWTGRRKPGLWSVQKLLLNFYNLGGIRFQNIAANDAVISSKINTMVEEGWELAFVNSAVESDAGKDDGQGIFITRYLFKRTKK